MGDLLDKPITEMEGEKEGETVHRFIGHNDVLKYGVRSVQGWRKKMEDTYLCALDIDVPISEDPDDEKIKPEDRVVKAQIFGVFDGHGGKEVAQYVSENFVRFLINTKEFQKEKYEDALKKAFLDIDEELKKNSGETAKRLNELKQEEIAKEKKLLEANLSGSNLTSEEKEELEVFKSIFDPRNLENCNISMFTGTAACVCLIVENRVYIANAGDSRCVLLSKDQKDDFKIQKRTKDHKPDDPDEKKRIELAEGFVDNVNNRLNGVLSLSRAIGDHEYKKQEWLKPEDQIITCNPDVISENINAIDYILIACDGVWEKYSEEETNEIIKLIAADKLMFGEGDDDNDSNLDKAIVELFKKLIRPLGAIEEKKKGLDNMTMIAIKVKEAYKALDGKFDEKQKARAQARKEKKEEVKRKEKEKKALERKQKEEQEKALKEKKKAEEALKLQQEKEKEESKINMIQKHEEEINTNVNSIKAEDKPKVEDKPKEEEKPKEENKKEDDKKEEEKPKEEEKKEEEKPKEEDKKEEEKPVDNNNQPKEENKPIEEVPKEENKPIEEEKPNEVPIEENKLPNDQPKEEVKSEEKKEEVKVEEPKPEESKSNDEQKPSEDVKEEEKKES